MKLKVVLLGVVLSSSAGVAMALTTLVGMNYTITFDSSQQGLFGNPVLVTGGANESVTWRPTAFTDTNQGSIFSSARVTVTANTGYDLSGFTFSESGQYRAWTKGTALSPATYDVHASGTLHVGSLLTSSVATGALASPGNSTTLQTWGSLTGGPVLLPTNTHTIMLQLDQTLYAKYTGTRARAYVNLTTADVGITTHALPPVPEPETYAMMLSGLVAIGFLARRRRQD